MYFLTLRKNLRFYQFLAVSTPYLVTNSSPKECPIVALIGINNYPGNSRPSHDSKSRAPKDLLSFCNHISSLAPRTQTRVCDNCHKMAALPLFSFNLGLPINLEGIFRGHPSFTSIIFLLLSCPFCSSKTELFLSSWPTSTTIWAPDPYHSQRGSQSLPQQAGWSVTIWKSHPESIYGQNKLIGSAPLSSE